MYQKSVFFWCRGLLSRFVMSGVQAHHIARRVMDARLQYQHQESTRHAMAQRVQCWLRSRPVRQSPRLMWT